MCFRLSLSGLHYSAIVLSLGLLFFPGEPGRAEPSPETEEIPPSRLGSCEWFTDSDDNLYLPTNPEEVVIRQNLVLTLEETIDCGFFGNRRLQQAYTLLKAAQDRWREARAAYIPELTITANADFYPDGSEIEIRDNGETDTDDDLVFIGRVGLEHDILTFGRRSASLRAAAAGIRFAELEIGRVAEEIQLELTLAYLDLQEIREIVLIREEAVFEAQRILDAAQGDLEISRATVQLADDQRRLTNVVNQQQILQRRFATLLNLREIETIQAAELIEIREQWPYSLEESIVAAYKNRPELRQALALRDVSIEERKRILADLRPLLQGFAGFGGNFVVDEFAVNSEEATALFFFRWEPFDLSGNIRARAAAKRREVELSEVRFSQIRSDIRFSVEASYLDLQTRIDNIETTHQGVENAIETLNTTRAQLDNVKVTQLDIIDAQNNLTLSRLNLASAVVGYDRALVKLKRAVGGQGQSVTLPEFDPGDLELLERLAPSYSESEAKPENSSENLSEVPVEVPPTLGIPGVDELSPTTSSLDPSGIDDLSPANNLLRVPGVDELSPIPRSSSPTTMGVSPQ